MHCRSGKGACLEDAPDEREFNVTKLSSTFVGLNFDANAQCRAQFGPSAIFCPFNSALKVNLYIK